MLNLVLAVKNARRLLKRKLVLLVLFLSLASVAVALIAAAVYNTMHMQSNVGVGAVQIIFTR